MDLLAAAEIHHPPGPVPDRPDSGHADAFLRGEAGLRGLGALVGCSESSAALSDVLSDVLAAVRLGRLDAGAQRLRQVGRTARLARGRRLADRPDDLVALDLGLHERLERLPVGVLVERRIEVLGHRVDQRGGHLQLLRTDVDVLVEELEVRCAHLVRPEQGLEDEHAVPYPQRRQGLPLPDRHLGHGHPPRSLERVAEQRVGADPGGLRLQVVGLVGQDRVQLPGRAEVQHVDPLGRRQRQLLQVVVGQHHDVAGGQLVALGHVGVGDLLAVKRAEPAVLDPAAVLGVDLPERHVTLLGGSVELDRDHDHAE